MNSCTSISASDELLEMGQWIVEYIESKLKPRALNTFCQSYEQLVLRTGLLTFRIISLSELRTLKLHDFHSLNLIVLSELIVL